MSSAAARNLKMAASPLVSRPPCARRLGPLRAAVPATATLVDRAPFKKERRLLFLGVVFSGCMDDFKTSLGRTAKVEIEDDNCYLLCTNSKPLLSPG